jgi:uncharacterized protein YecT (DUF1311 family)
MRINFLILCFIPLSLFAADKPSIIETAKRFKLDIAVVREYHETGCESGFPSKMYICGAHHFVVADMELNKVYIELMTEMQTKAGKEKLKSAEKAWVEFRDKVCEFEADGYTEGPDFGAVVLSCKRAYSEERAVHLRKFVNCGGLLGCPGIEN